MDFRLIRKLSSPLIPYGQPDEIAGVVALMASSDASYISGEKIVVEGALTSQT